MWLNSLSGLLLPAFAGYHQDSTKIDVYKLRIEDTESKILDKDLFEAETFRREPWYQPGSGAKLAQFAVCPACDNPVQLVGLYDLPPNVKNPYGKHTTKSIQGIAPFDGEPRPPDQAGRIRLAKLPTTRKQMSPELTEEEMRRALFGSPALAEQINVTPIDASQSDIAAAQPVNLHQKKKVDKAFTPRLKVTLHVGNEFEGKTYEIVHEADTLSTLIAEQEAVRLAKIKYRYVEVVSVKSM